MYEYKVLGKAAVGGKVLYTTLNTVTVPQSNILDVQEILNSLAKDGWELVDITYPGIFRRELAS